MKELSSFSLETLTAMLLSFISQQAANNWVNQAAKDAQLVASVCTGAFILAEAGLLSDLKATTHWEDIDNLKNSYSSLIVVSSQRWVDEGKFVTSGGISAGIDMSLHLVSRLSSLALAEKTARQMEFEWCKNS
jgi:transcriptional regulator GlxA family with amidase domain